jgi:SAM-dependent methyltransferase
VLDAQPHHAGVKEHYRALAPSYGARANRTCERIYQRLVHRHLAGRPRLLELGGGSSRLLESLGSPGAVACDISPEMLRMRPGGEATHRVAAAGERLPFADACFDGLFSVNVLEHVTDVGRVVAESSRVLDRGGIWMAITPNGNWEFLLDLAERWNLKIPEGPHAFLTTQGLGQAAREYFDVIEHRTCLVFPAGPPSLTALLDHLTICAKFGWGFFQYFVGQKKR